MNLFWSRKASIIQAVFLKSCIYVSYMCDMKKHARICLLLCTFKYCNQGTGAIKDSTTCFTTSHVEFHQSLLNSLHTLVLLPVLDNEFDYLILVWRWRQKVLPLFYWMITDDVANFYWTSCTWNRSIHHITQHPPVNCS